MSFNSRKDAEVFVSNFHAFHDKLWDAEAEWTKESLSQWFTEDCEFILEGHVIQGLNKALKAWKELKNLDVHSKTLSVEVETFTLNTVAFKDHESVRLGQGVEFFFKHKCNIRVNRRGKIERILMEFVQPMTANNEAVTEQMIFEEMMRLCPLGKKSAASCESLYQFRPITRNNVDCVRGLHDKLLPIQMADEFYESMLNGDLGSLLLYKADNDQIIGISTWRLPNDSKNIGYICSFGMRKSFRKRGLGKDLMDATLKKMGEQNCREIQLHDHECVCCQSVSEMWFHQKKEGY